MLGWVRKRQQAAAVAQGIATTPATSTVKNLQSSIPFIPDLTPQEYSDTMNMWYDEFGKDKPMELAEMLHEVSLDMRTNGDPNKAGPQLFLMNIGGGNIEILHSITKAPPDTEEPSKSINKNSKFLRKTNPYMGVISNRKDSQDTWMVVPVNPKTYFGKKKGKLATWSAFPQPRANDTSPLPAAGGQQEFYPMLPLPTRAMAAEAIACLYPNKVNLRMLAHKMYPHIDDITDQTTKEQAQRSLLAMVTKKTARESRTSAIFLWQD